MRVPKGWLVMDGDACLYMLGYAHMSHPVLWEVKRMYGLHRLGSTKHVCTLNPSFKASRLSPTQSHSQPLIGEVTSTHLGSCPGKGEGCIVAQVGV